MRLGRQSTSGSPIFIPAPTNWGSDTAAAQPGSAGNRPPPAVSSPTAPQAPVATTQQIKETIKKIATVDAKSSIYTETLDLPSVGANSTVEASVVIPTKGRIKEGDIVCVLGIDELTHGLFIQAGLPSVTDDTARLRITNVLTGTDLDTSTLTAYLQVIRP